MSLLKRNKELIGTWMIEYIRERPVMDNSPASIVLDEEDRLSGNASCNNYFGKYDASGSDITLNALGKSNKMCIVEALMEQEARFLAALPDVRSYKILEGILVLFDENGEIVFKAAQHN